MTVHELARRVGIAAHVVRYYTQRGFLRPDRNPRNGYRAYGESDLHRLRFICRAQIVGFSLSDYYDQHQTAAYVYGEQFITQRPDVGRRWMVANLRGVRDYYEWQRRGQPADDLAGILARSTNLPIELVTQANWEHMNPDGHLNTQAIETDQRQLLE